MEGPQLAGGLSRLDGIARAANIPTQCSGLLQHSAPNATASAAKCLSTARCGVPQGLNLTVAVGNEPLASWCATA